MGHHQCFKQAAGALVGNSELQLMQLANIHILQMIVSPGGFDIAAHSKEATAHYEIETTTDYHPDR
jgi:hypothetical protein